MTLPRSLQRALAVIRRYFREWGCPPSLGDLGHELRVSRSRAHELVVGLEEAGRITRTPGQALSIRLVDPQENRSDDDLLLDLGSIVNQLERRGIDPRIVVPAIPLKTAYQPQPLTDLELPGSAELSDLLGRIDGGDDDGQGDRTEDDEGTGPGLKAA